MINEFYEIFHKFLGEKTLSDEKFLNKKDKNKYATAINNTSYIFEVKEDAKNVIENYILAYEDMLSKTKAGNMKSYGILDRYYALKNAKKADKIAYKPIKNRICYFLNHSLPIRSSGYATRSQYVAKALQNAGFDLIAVTKEDFGKKGSIDEIDGIKYVRQSLKSLKYKLIRNKYERIIKVHEDTILNLKPEFILTASNNLTAIPAICAAKRLGVPVCYEVRGLWEISRLSNNPQYANTLECHFEKYYEAQACIHSDKVFVITNGVKDELINRGVNEDKFTLFPNCADISKFKPQEKNAELLEKLNIPKNTPVIGYIGTIQNYEGLDDLINACKILKDENIDFRTLLVGSSPEWENAVENLKKLAKELNLENEIIITGKIPLEEVPKYYSLIDIAPFGRKAIPVCKIVSPIKPLEAMAMGKTVIVSNLQALEEIVQNEKTGLVFESQNPNSLAHALKKVILDPSLREELGKNAIQWIEKNRQWKNQVELIKEEINKLKA